MKPQPFTMLPLDEIVKVVPTGKLWFIYGQLGTCNWLCTACRLNTIPLVLVCWVKESTTIKLGTQNRARCFRIIKVSS